MGQNYKSYFIVGIICLVLGGAIIFAIGTGANNKYVEQLSNQIAIGAETNRRLADENKQLTGVNSELTGSVDRLQSRINADAITIAKFQRSITERDKQYAATIGSIETAIRNATEGFGQAKDDLSGIITVLEEVKTLIQSLP